MFKLPLMIRLLFIALLTVATFGADTTRRYILQRKLSGVTVNRITIGGGTRALRLDGGYFQCSVSCSPYISQRGTVTGGSSGASLVKRADGRAPTTPTFSVTLDGTVASDESLLDPPVNISAGGDLPFSGHTYLPVSSQNILTFELAHASGDSYIQIFVSEF